MDIHAAIDLLGGRAVRLSQGRRESAVTYSDEPWQVAADFAASGAAQRKAGDSEPTGRGSAKQPIRPVPSGVQFHEMSRVANLRY